jgi:hypothetical protein
MKTEQSLPKAASTNGPPRGRPSEQQLALLGFFSSREFSDEEIRDIQTLIANYYAEKADVEMDALVEEKGWTQENFDQMGNEHIRTSYRPQDNQ